MGQLAIHRSIWSGRAVETSRRRQRRHADGREHLLGVSEEATWAEMVRRDESCLMKAMEDLVVQKPY